jgi:hypothetical protein
MYAHALCKTGELCLVTSKRLAALAYSPVCSGVTHPFDAHKLSCALHHPAGVLPHCLSPQPSSSVRPSKPCGAAQAWLAGQGSAPHQHKRAHPLRQLQLRQHLPVAA